MFMSSQNTFALDQRAKIDCIVAKLAQLDSIENQQALMMTRLDTINAKVTENKTLIDKATSKILEIETSQTFMSDKSTRCSSHPTQTTSKYTKYRVSSKV